MADSCTRESRRILPKNLTIADSFFFVLSFLSRLEYTEFFARPPKKKTTTASTSCDGVGVSKILFKQVAINLSPSVYRARLFSIGKI